MPAVLDEPTTRATVFSTYPQEAPVTGFCLDDFRGGRTPEIGSYAEAAAARDARRGDYEVFIMPVTADDGRDVPEVRGLSLDAERRVRAALGMDSPTGDMPAPEVLRRCGDDPALAEVAAVARWAARHDRRVCWG